MLVPSDTCGTQKHCQWREWVGSVLSLNIILFFPVETKSQKPADTSDGNWGPHSFWWDSSGRYHKGSAQVVDLWLKSQSLTPNPHAHSDKGKKKTLRLHCWGSVSWTGTKKSSFLMMASDTSNRRVNKTHLKWDKKVWFTWEATDIIRRKDGLSYNLCGFRNVSIQNRLGHTWTWERWVTATSCTGNPVTLQSSNGDTGWSWLDGERQEDSGDRNLCMAVQCALKGHLPKPASHYLLQPLNLKDLIDQPWV